MSCGRYLLLLLAGGLASMSCGASPTPDSGREWLAGDPHVHSQWSPAYDRDRDPPRARVGGDGAYSTLVNAQQALRFGLSWLVTTDHGGPDHARLNRNHAYLELEASRARFPDLLQFYGLELNMPGMDHHTVIMPRSDGEAPMLFDLERQFDAHELWPQDPSRNTTDAARHLLSFARALEPAPLIFASHPSRSASGLGRYGLDEPRELRDNNDRAPLVYRGLEGAPGQQAAALAPDGSGRRDEDGHLQGNRGGYRRLEARTLGGFDQMTAVVGGLWDALLGEGRRFWIVGGSDSRRNYTDPETPGGDFWPGQYLKTVVHARKTYEDVLEGLRAGRMFVTSGDLVSELDVILTRERATAGMGETLAVTAGTDVTVTIRFRDPEAANANGDTPRVARVDLIVGTVNGPAFDRGADRNASTRVVARFTSADWVAEHVSGDGATRPDVYVIHATLESLAQDIYVRVRGTSGLELEPLMDVTGENPWSDLWFYSNPVFVDVSEE